MKHRIDITTIPLSLEAKKSLGIYLYNYLGNFLSDATQRKDFEEWYRKKYDTKYVWKFKVKKPDSLKDS